MCPDVGWAESGEQDTDRYQHEMFATLKMESIWNKANIA